MGRKETVSSEIVGYTRVNFEGSSRIVPVKQVVDGSTKYRGSNDNLSGNLEASGRDMLRGARRIGGIIVYLGLVSVVTETITDASLTDVAAHTIMHPVETTQSVISTGEMAVAAGESIVHGLQKGVELAGKLKDIGG